MKTCTNTGTEDLGHPRVSWQSNFDILYRKGIGAPQTANDCNDYHSQVRADKDSCPPRPKDGENVMISPTNQSSMNAATDMSYTHRLKGGVGQVGQACIFFISHAVIEGRWRGYLDFAILVRVVHGDTADDVMHASTDGEPVDHQHPKHPQRQVLHERRIVQVVGQEAQCQHGSHKHWWEEL